MSNSVNIYWLCTRSLLTRTIIEIKNNDSDCSKQTEYFFIIFQDGYWKIEKPNERSNIDGWMACVGQSILPSIYWLQMKMFVSCLVSLYFFLFFLRMKAFLVLIRKKWKKKMEKWWFVVGEGGTSSKMKGSHEFLLWHVLILLTVNGSFLLLNIVSIFNSLCTWLLYGFFWKSHSLSQVGIWRIWQESWKVNKIVEEKYG